MNKTIDGCTIYQFFQWYDTHGIPLDVIMTMAIEESFALDWQDFWWNSMEKYWNPDSTFSKLKANVLEVYGIDFYNQWLPRMKQVIINIILKQILY